MKRFLVWMVLTAVLCVSAGVGLAEQNQPEADEKIIKTLMGTIEMRRVTEEDQKRIVAELRALDIVIPDEAVSQYNSFYAKQTEKRVESGYFDENAFSIMETPQGFARNILMSVGLGDYNILTGIWKPSFSGVYSFDAEVYDIEHMYRQFLRGVASIVPGFEVSEMKETTETIEKSSPLTPFKKLLGIDDDVEMIKHVSFTIHGHTYEKKLTLQDDWFNEKAIRWVNEALAREGFSGRLHVYYDGYQGIIMIYGDQERSNRIGKLLGWN